MYSNGLEHEDPCLQMNILLEIQMLMLWMILKTETTDLNCRHFIFSSLLCLIV
jgi:hypothetical protein